MAHSLPPIAEIELRWTLRDIAAGRFNLMRLSDHELQNLLDQGLVEMRDNEPALTNAGFAKIAISASLSAKDVEPGTNQHDLP